MSFDEVFSFIVGTPHPLEKIGWGHRCANVIHKLGKEPVLDRCQVDSDPIRRHFVYHQINIEESVLEPVLIGVVAFETAFRRFASIRAPAVH